MSTLPNFLIVGAAKSGTTSLYKYLLEHPDIYLPQKRKELRFFSSMSADYKGPGDENINQSIIQSIDEYKVFFDDVVYQKAIGESSPDYLYHYEKSVENIKKYLGDVKIIIILREPVSRAYSHYLMYVRDGREELSFEDALINENDRIQNNWEWGWAYKYAGLYHTQVKAYLENFSNVKVYLFDDLKNDESKLMKDLYGFLDVDASFIATNLDEKFNISGVPKYKFIQKLITQKNIIKTIVKPIMDFVLSAKMKKTIVDRIKNKNLIRKAMSEGTKKELKEFYAEDIKKLELLIDRDLSIWLR